MQYQVPRFNRHFKPLIIMNDSLYDLPGGEKFPRDTARKRKKRGEFNSALRVLRNLAVLSKGFYARDIPSFVR
jgi:hypothetical protein